MKLTIENDSVVCSRGNIKGVHPVLDAREIGERVLVLYDYMAFPRGEPSRNLFAYDLDGNQLWRAEGIGLGAVDGYTSFLSESPLVLGNFAGYSCTIDVSTGKVIDTVFTK
jgi:hypothetical protein